MCKWDRMNESLPNKRIQLLLYFVGVRGGIPKGKISCSALIARVAAKDRHLPLKSPSRWEGSLTALASAQTGLDAHLRAFDQSLLAVTPGDPRDAKCELGRIGPSLAHILR
jgi:hypothetical protein